VAGPALVVLLVATVSAASALVVSAVAVVVGTLLFLSRLPADVGGRAGTGDPLGALRSAGIRTLVLSMVPVGVGIGALEVSLPAFADAEGHRDLAGLLIALWSVGSAAGGLAYGARPRRSPLARVHLQIALLLPLTLALVALASSFAAKALLVIPAGVCLAPLIATRNELAGTVALPGTETEAYSWPLTALVAGVAAGAAIAGVMADGAGWRAAVIVGACSSALGATISLARRGTLVPAVRS
jgi:MFS family permease